MGDDKSINSHGYLLDISEKTINSVLYELGTKYDRIVEGLIDSTLYSERFSIKEKKIPNSLFYFLTFIEFIDDIDHYLTEDGKKYFELLYILQDAISAFELIKQKMIKHPVVNLIGQVFYGRGKITVEQLRILLNYHNIAGWEIEYKQITSLLTLLNKFNIVVYDKKNMNFYLKDPINIEVPIRQYYVTPSTPFSNIYNVRKIIRACRGKIFWIDKHFRKEGFEIILDGLAFEGVSHVTIISGTDNITQSAKYDFEALRGELNERKINVSWYVITDKTFKWHDRWIVSDNLCYNIPPILSIIRGQRADILKKDVILDINPFFQASINLNSYNV